MGKDDWTMLALHLMNRGGVKEVGLGTEEGEFLEQEDPFPSHYRPGNRMTVREQVREQVVTTWS